MSITDLLEEGKGAQTRITGVVIGIVTNNQDPDKLGRVKVKLPRLSGVTESTWARVAAAMAGKDRGTFMLPEVDDEVLVAFEHGDITMPYVIGALWNGVDTPPETNSDGKNNIRMIKSRSGHIVRLDDKDSDEKIEIIDKTGKNSITITTKDNTISICADKDIKISAPNGKLIVDAKDIEVKSSAATKIESGSGMDVKATGTLNIKGATVNIN